MMNKITKMGTVASKVMTTTKEKASEAWSFTKDKTIVVKDSVVKACSDAKESFLVGFNGTEGQGSICDYLEESNSKVLSINIEDDKEYVMLYCGTITEDRHFKIFAYDDDTWYVVEA